MSDVLLSNALESQYKLEKDVAAFGPAAEIFPTDSAGIPGPARAGDWDSDISAFTDAWNMIPVMDSPIGSLCVIDYDSSYWRCDRSCNWTVPSGVTEAKFQLWGPGGGTGQNCCCGGAPYGPTGAYMTFTKTVSASQVYCIHTGCASCCCGSQTTPGVCGSPTCLEGPGLSGVCVDSGCSCWQKWWSDLGWSPGSNSNNCYVPNLDGCSPTSCSGWNYCWDSGNDDTTVPFAYSSSTGHGVIDDVVAGTKHIINGMWPYISIGECNEKTCHISSPVYGFVDQMTGCNPSSNSNGGHCKGATQGFHQFPAQGGSWNYAQGGINATSYRGDYGRAGMVCIQWK